MGRPKLPPPETMTWMGETFCPVCGHTAETQIIIAKTVAQARKIIKQYGAWAKLPLGISKTICKDCKDMADKENGVYIVEAKEEPDAIPFTGRYVLVKKEALTNTPQESDYYAMKSSEFKQLFEKEITIKNETSLNLLPSN